MSLSPTEDSTSDEVRQYDVGWAATNKLIRQGKSFSGGERHCAFLNLGGGARFATVSGAAGLDLVDDGRGLALADWDYDGRVDFWLTNRTGPRVRFLHNRYGSGNGFVALRLVGADANRDGVGARVTVELADGAKLARTLYAGSGYLSQSSKWLHFGVPAGGSVAAVEVRWPGGSAERFTGAAAGGFYHLEQGAGAARGWEPPRFDSAAMFESPPVEAPDDGGPARVLPVLRPPMPDTLAAVGAGGEMELSSFRGAPLVVQLWATWCPNCAAEMEEWKAAAEAIEATGAKVLPVCVDEPTDDRAADLARAAAAAAERGYPWETAVADAHLIEHLNIIQKAYVGRQEDLPLPSAFLIDAAGDLVAIYKGNVSPEVLVADLAVAGGGEDREAVVARALPYGGQWLERPPGTMPRSIAIRLVEHGLDAEARTYLRQILPRYAGPGAAGDGVAEDTRLRELNECHSFLGALAYDAGDKAEAVAHYLSALALFPNNRDLRHELMRCYMDLGDHELAAGQVEALLADRPDDFENLAQLALLRAKLGQRDEAVELYGRSLALRDHPETHNMLANLLRDSGRAAEAAPHYRAALEGRPGWPLPANNLAWILATHPHADVRDGAAALRFAGIADAATGGEVPPILSTLAAAQAEAGDFAAAAATLEKAIALAEAEGKGELSERLAERLAAAKRGEPHRDPALAGTEPGGADE